MTLVKLKELNIFSYRVPVSGVRERSERLARQKRQTKRCTCTPCISHCGSLGDARVGLFDRSDDHRAHSLRCKRTATGPEMVISIRSDHSSAVRQTNSSIPRDRDAVVSWGSMRPPHRRVLCCVVCVVWWWFHNYVESSRRVPGSITLPLSPQRWAIVNPSHQRTLVNPP